MMRTFTNIFFVLNPRKVLRKKIDFKENLKNRYASENLKFSSKKYRHINQFPPKKGKCQAFKTFLRLPIHSSLSDMRNMCIENI